MTTYETVDYTLENGVATARMNQPDSLNAMTATLGSELLDAIHRASKEARALVIGGNGRAFSAGANLNQLTFELDDPQRDIGIGLETTFNPMMETLRDYPIPVITAVKGAAAGIGCSIALMGDLIIAGTSAYFLQAFRHVGLVPDGGSAYILTHAIGRVRAMEMMLLGQKYPAQKALESGLITRLVEDDEVDSTAAALAAELAAGPAVSLRGIRRAAWAAYETSFSEQLNHERAQQRIATRTNDFVEGVKAFRARRKPNFTGT
jgi:2-(1,2-epoxy-1,2-dihydrophenyl)acetyl-CoA isomerase